MLSLALLQLTWYILLGILFIGYSILDGFDLGVATLFPFLAKTNDEKKALLAMLGPIWDGNEVWLLTAGGALFAAFPPAYATVFSGFYTALMLVLFALIFRAVAFEFRHYAEQRQRIWEWALVLGSAVPSLLFGVALGNVIVGIPINANGDFTGTFFTLLRPYPILIGLLGLLAILQQGAAFAALKSSGALWQRARRANSRLSALFLAAFVCATIAAYIAFPALPMSQRILAYMGVFVVLLAWLLARSAMRQAQGDGELANLIWSASQFCGLWLIAASLHFPNLVKADNNAQYSLTIYNSSSSLLTLQVMLVIAVIGMPLVIGYTIFAYRVFKGKADQAHNPA